MAVFFNNAITDEGTKLLAKMQTGAKFVATKFVMGSGYIPSGKTAKTMTAVATPEHQFNVTEVKQTPASASATIGGIFSNKDITAGFYYRELGLYAKIVYEDGTETAAVLYAYGNAGDSPDLIPAYSTETVVESIIRLIVYVGNNTTVTIAVESGVYVTKDAYDKKIEELESKIQEAAVMTDATTSKKYKWGVENGVVFVQEV